LALSHETSDKHATSNTALESRDRNITFFYFPLQTGTIYARKAHIDNLGRKSTQTLSKICQRDNFAQ
jgi:hypothetical protein